LSIDNNKKEQSINDLMLKLSEESNKLQLSEADNRRLKKTLRLWQAGSLGTGAALVLILLIL
jgi:cell shape-determining protein MreC